MKIALCTLMDDDFVVGFNGFWKSFLYHNPWFRTSNIDFLILDNGISQENKDHMLKLCPKIIFKKINYKAYSETNFNKTHDKLKATFYTLDVFRLYEYDRVVFLDMDITVLADIKELFKSNDTIRACKQYNAKMDCLNNAINSGVFTVNKEAINKSIYNALIRMSQRGMSMPDQKIINGHFSGKITHFNKRLNVEKRMLHSVAHKDIYKGAKILHWISDKPWMKEKRNDIERSFIEAEAIWHHYNDMDFPVWEDESN